MTESNRTASLMSPAKLARMKQRQPAASPAAWLDQMAADVGGAHLAQLAEVTRKLLAQGADRSLVAVEDSLNRLIGVQDALDFSSFQAAQASTGKGWFSRFTEKPKTGHPQFVEQHERINEAARELAQRVQAAQPLQQAQAAASERLLVELDFELKALQGQSQQASRWLQDMRGQLEQRRAAAAADPQAQQQLRHDTGRCDILVQRLQRLATVAESTQQVIEQVRAGLARRAALMQTLGQTWPAAHKNWQIRLAGLAAAAAGQGDAVPAVDEPRQVHQALLQQTAQAVQECGQSNGADGQLEQLLNRLLAQANTLLGS